MQCSAISMVCHLLSETQVYCDIAIEAFLSREAAMLARSWDRNSVCPSVTRMLCGEMKKNILQIF